MYSILINLLYTPIDRAIDRSIFYKASMHNDLNLIGGFLDLGMLYIIVGAVAVVLAAFTVDRLVRAVEQFAKRKGKHD